MAVTAVASLFSSFVDYDDDDDGDGGVNCYCYLNRSLLGQKSLLCDVPYLLSSISLLYTIRK